MIHTKVSTWKIPKKQKREGFVYVATNLCYERRSIYKIGYAKNIKRRMEALSTGHIFTMYPVLVFRFKDCRKMERQIHNELKEFQLKQSHSKEYFRLSDSQLFELKYTYNNNVDPRGLVDNEWVSNTDELNISVEFDMMFDSFYGHY